MSPDQWAAVWAKLRQRAPQLDAGVAPAWFAALRGWTVDAVLAALDSLPPGPVTFEQIRDVIAPPPPDVDVAFEQAKARREWHDKGPRQLDADDPAPPVHSAVVQALALLDGEPLDEQRWRDAYRRVLRLGTPP